MGATTAFTMQYPDLVNYLAFIMALGLFSLVIYTWKTSWKQQNAINESILHRLEALDKETDAKIERLSEEVRKADVIHETIRQERKAGMTDENEVLRTLIKQIKSLTEQISKIEVIKTN